MKSLLLPLLRSSESGAKEEDPHRVQPESGVPARVHFRPEALPEQLGAGRAGRLTAAHRDPGEDLVPEPQEQVEEADRCGHGGQQRWRRLRCPEGRQGFCVVSRECRHACDADQPASSVATCGRLF